MVKWKSAFDSNEEPESLSGFNPYDGPELPFTGVFPMKLKTLRMKKNKNGDDMLNGLLEVYAPRKSDPKHKWHGAPLWFNLNQTAQGAPWTKAFIQGMGVKWAEFVAYTILSDADYSKENPADVTRLGKLKLNGEQTVKVSLKGSKTSTDYPDKRAEVGSWLLWSGKNEAEDADEYDDGDLDEDDDLEEDADEDADDDTEYDDDDDDDSDDDGDDYEEEEEEPEPEPAPRKAVRRAPAKATTRRGAKPKDSDPPF